MRMHRHRARCGRRGTERGSQVVEFALLAPILLLVTMIALDGGRMVATYTALKNAAYQAALYAARNPNASAADLKEVVRTEGNGVLAVADITALAVADVNQSNGQVMRNVTATYRFRFTNPILQPSPLFISTTGSFRK